ncbi:alpha/beta fold hydrolase [Tsukamurella asaccharolytica]|uniref:Alpha/beta fold hydrolase n=1 Tax=Tsukamurella asaccharolytica TaxID=2592067 RepID=A0A5C5RC98_9ACTN|nr:alpha/beta fold hydrolase [Tsukamurella asaccharolytica]TWS19815.1 alpha/beta fold hydrolase [Tsukamurella asaccharolytica]
MSTAERPRWVDDELFPFTSRFVDLDGHTVHYIDEGSGPTLLMLHGNPTWSFLWRDVIRDLSSAFRCIAVDYPGFGLSTAAPGYHYLPEEHTDVIGSFVDALDISGATLVGQDWGGPIGLAVTQRRPGTFDRLVLTNTWAWPTNGDLYFEGFSRIGGASPLRLLARHVDLVVNTFIPMGHHRRKPSPAEMAHYRQAQATPQRRQASAILPSRIIASRGFFTDIESRLGEVDHLPTLIVWGGASWVFRHNELKRLESTFRDRQTVTIDGAGLYAQSDAPTDFAAAIRNWHLQDQS